MPAAAGGPRAVVGRPDPEAPPPPPPLLRRPRLEDRSNAPTAAAAAAANAPAPLPLLPCERAEAKRLSCARCARFPPPESCGKSSSRSITSSDATLAPPALKRAEASRLAGRSGRASSCAVFHCISISTRDSRCGDGGATSLLISGDGGANTGAALARRPSVSNVSCSPSSRTSSDMPPPRPPSCNTSSSAPVAAVATEFHAPGRAAAIAVAAAVEGVRRCGGLGGDLSISSASSTSNVSSMSENPSNSSLPPPALCALAGGAVAADRAMPAGRAAAVGSAIAPGFAVLHPISSSRKSSKRSSSPSD
mmetsp:Transcript_40324/g.120273  ORF Transcript_40324/g.120273 Transcript_40324/m.120273 type:complete len:307 (-) Transcript_40324:1064-1984(-)